MKGKILVIEDNIDWQDKLRKYLEKEGYFVKVVDNADLALKELESERFHFITLDMQLDEEKRDAKNFEGWTILELVKKLRIQFMTPVMIITGYGAQYKDLKGKKGVESLFYMEKGSFDKKDFLNTINKNVEAIDLRFKNDYRGD